jgi:hypothetical protein
MQSTEMMCYCLSLGVRICTGKCQLFVCVNDFLSIYKILKWIFNNKKTDGACITYTETVTCIQDFGGETSAKKATW